MVAKHLAPLVMLSQSFGPESNRLKDVNVAPSLDGVRWTSPHLFRFIILGHGLK